MSDESMSLQEMLFWFFLTLFGTGPFFVNGSISLLWRVCGILMIVVGFTGMVVCAWPTVKKWYSLRQNRNTDEQKGPPISLKQLFEIDWPNLPAFYHECVLNSPIFESGSVKVAWRVNGDFIGRSKFLAILIDATTKSSDAFKACESIAGQFAYFIDSVNSEVDIEGQAPHDTAPTHLRDMVFSKRIFIYYEDFSLAQKGTLETIYQSKELSVQFRDAAYVWAHRADRRRQTPLVPNTTILPDAKLNDGLQIKITKLSPGPGEILTEKKESLSG